MITLVTQDNLESFLKLQVKHKSKLRFCKNKKVVIS